MLILLVSILHIGYSELNKLIWWHEDADPWIYAIKLFSYRSQFLATCPALDVLWNETLHRQQVQSYFEQKKVSFFWVLPYMLELFAQMKNIWCIFMSHISLFLFNCSIFIVWVPTPQIHISVWPCVRYKFDLYCIVPWCFLWVLRSFWWFALHYFHGVRIRAVNGYLCTRLTDRW